MQPLDLGGDFSSSLSKCLGMEPRCVHANCCSMSGCCQGTSRKGVPELPGWSLQLPGCRRQEHAAAWPDSVKEDQYNQLAPRHHMGPSVAVSWTSQLQLPLLREAQHQPGLWASQERCGDRRPWDQTCCPRVPPSAAGGPACRALPKGHSEWGLEALPRACLRGAVVE